MRLGVIDLGTNSLRYSFWEYEAPNGTHGHLGRPQLLHRKKTMILPGQDVFRRGEIPARSVKRILKSLKSFDTQAQILGADSVVALATCAMREAHNSKEVLQKIRQFTSVPLQVISGQREAELIAQGVFRAEPRMKARRILIDIGGGSTEISIVDNRKVIESCSLPLGAQRLFQLYPKLMKGTVSEERWEIATDLRAFVRQCLQQKLKNWPTDTANEALGSSGTIRCLGKLISRRRAANRSRQAWIRQAHSTKKGPLTYRMEELKRLNVSLFFLTETQLDTLAGVEPVRRPLLTHGALLLEEIFNHFGLRRLHCTEGSLRDGVLYEFENGLLKPHTYSAKPGINKKSARKSKTKKKSKKKKALKR